MYDSKVAKVSQTWAHWGFEARTYSCI